MGSSKCQGGMGRCLGQNAGMFCWLCCIQGSTSLWTWKSVINKTILLLQNPPKTLNMHYDLQGSWTSNFNPVYEKRLFLERLFFHKRKSKLIHFNITNPKNSSFYSSKPAPHLYTCLFSLSNMYHSLKSLGDKSAWTPDENTCTIIFSTGSIHISSSLNRGGKRINQA